MTRLMLASWRWCQCSRGQSVAVAAFLDRHTDLLKLNGPSAKPGISPSNVFPLPHISKRGAKSSDSRGVVTLVNLM
eukprot:5687458-Karenia_brevis.AAC.1